MSHSVCHLWVHVLTVFLLCNVWLLLLILFCTQCDCGAFGRHLVRWFKIHVFLYQDSPNLWRGGHSSLRGPLTNHQQLGFLFHFVLSPVYRSPRRCWRGFLYCNLPLGGRCMLMFRPARAFLGLVGLLVPQLAFWHAFNPSFPSCMTLYRAGQESWDILTPCATAVNF